MTSPIKNQINTIFVHVSDLQRSVAWYSELLGQEVSPQDVTRPVYNVKINDHTGLTLDAGPEGSSKPKQVSPHPLFNFHTDDIEQAYQFVRELGFSIDTEIVRFEDFAFFTISDPDGHVVMICTG